MELLKKCFKDGKEEAAVARVKELLESGADPQAMVEAMAESVTEMGKALERGEATLQDMAATARALKAAAELLKHSAEK